MAKFQEFSSGFGSLFDKGATTPLVDKRGFITRGIYQGLPVVYREGVAGVDVFGKWFALQEDK